MKKTFNVTIVVSEHRVRGSGVTGGLQLEVENSSPIQLENQIIGMIKKQHKLVYAG